MTKAQQTYERIETLVGEGTAKADAFKQLAAEYGQSVDSVRGAYYTGRKQSTGQASTRGRRSQRRETTEHDAIDRAIETMQNAIASIEHEVEQAGERAEEAQREHQALKEAAGPRIEVIKSKIAALTAE